MSTGSNKQLDRLDVEMTRLRETLTGLAVGQRILADDVVRTKANLRERMDVLESFMGQTIDHVQDHTGDPDAHEGDR